MADYRAIWIVCRAVIEFLRGNYKPEYFDGNELEFKLLSCKDFAIRPFRAGVSLLLYRIYHNIDFKIDRGPQAPDGRTHHPPLSLNLHFLLTPWGQSPELQLCIAGWMMRMMYDSPVLSAEYLNSLSPGVFRPEEHVEIVLDELGSEDTLKIREAIGASLCNPSIPYVARKVVIE